jgi:hypothetical protein
MIPHSTIAIAIALPPVDSTPLQLQLRNQRPNHNSHPSKATL